jgi:FMN-dependent NADH-azoreductase
METRNMNFFSTLNGSKQLRVLRLDASASPADSASRQLGDARIARLRRSMPVDLCQRDLNTDARFIDAGWIDANFTPCGERSREQCEKLRFSDTLIGELNWANHILLTTPMYNFSVPATLKAWIDLVCRAGVTFSHDEDGPVGLLSYKSAEIIITTGGVPLCGEEDYVSGYLRQVFAFLGIDDIEIIGADRMNKNAEDGLARALARIELGDSANTLAEVA